MSQPRCQHSAPGYTLIELLLVIGLIGILAGLAIGFSASFRQRLTFKEVAREVFHGMSLARARAVERGTNAKVQFVDRAIIVFIDSLPEDHQYTEGEALLYRWPSSGRYDARVTIESTNLNANGRQTAIFDHRGFSLDPAGALMAPVVCLRDAELGQRIAVQSTVAGAVRVISDDQLTAICP